MPRPRSHVLEEISRKKFHEKLPSHWIFREKSHDYGVDAEVELFTSDGLEEGLTFLVQLKATDSKDPSKIKGVDFKIQTLDYYKRLDLPVLLVRYSSHEDMVYWKWVYNVDLYDTKRGAKSHRVSLKEKDQWASNSPDLIRSRLISLRALKSGKLKLPVEVTLHFDKTLLEGSNKPLIINQLIRHLKRRRNYIQYTSLTEASLIVTIGKQVMKVSLLDSAGAYFHNIDLESSTSAQDLEKKILLGLATGLIQSNYVDQGAEIIFENNLESILMPRRALVSSVLPKLLKSSYFSEVLKVIGEILDNRIFEDATALIASLNVLLSSNSNSTHKKIELERFYEERITSAELSEDNLNIGASYYNLGNYYYRQGFFYRALKCYLSAKRHYPSYLYQEYFTTDLAGILFYLERYSLACKLYDCSVKRKAPIKVTALLADAYMSDGEYEKARKTFAIYQEEAPEPDPEFVLKWYCLEQLLKGGAQKSQHRKPTKVSQIFEFEKMFHEGHISSHTDEMLGLDLLQPIVWFNLGIYYKDNQHWSEGAFAFTFAGLLDRNDIEAWAHATVCSINIKEKQVHILALIIKVAYSINGDAYLDQLSDLLSTSIKDGFNKTVLMNAIDKVINDESDKEDDYKIEFRLINDNGEFIKLRADKDFNFEIIRC